MRLFTHTVASKCLGQLSASGSYALVIIGTLATCRKCGGALQYLHWSRQNFPRSPPYMCLGTASAADDKLVLSIYHMVGGKAVVCSCWVKFVNLVKGCLCFGEPFYNVVGVSRTQALPSFFLHPGPFSSSKPSPSCYVFRRSGHKWRILTFHQAGRGMLVLWAKLSTEHSIRSSYYQRLFQVTVNA